MSNTKQYPLIDSRHICEYVEIAHVLLAITAKTAMRNFNSSYPDRVRLFQTDTDFGTKMYNRHSIRSVLSSALFGSVCDLFVNEENFYGQELAASLTIECLQSTLRVFVTDS